MKKIAVCADFVTEPFRRQISEAAEKAGFSVNYFETHAALAEKIADFEILFGYIPPAFACVR